MLQSFVRIEVSSDDLSYLAKWLMVDYRHVTLEEYIAKIQEFLAVDFFDTPNKIKQVIKQYTS